MGRNRAIGNLPAKGFQMRRVPEKPNFVLETVRAPDQGSVVFAHLEHVGETLRAELIQGRLCVALSIACRLGHFAILFSV
jgi:hypothetical protein